MRRSLVSGVIAGTAALALGFFCGQFFQEPAEESEKPELQGESTTSFAPTNPLFSDDSFDGDFGKWLDQLEALKGNYQPTIESELTKRKRMKQWIEEAPDAAFSYFEKSEEAGAASLAILRIWMLQDPASFLQRAELSENSDLISLVTSAAPYVDPIFFLEYAKQQTDSPEWLVASIPIALEKLAKTDPESALRLASEFDISIGTMTIQSFGNPIGSRTIYSAKFHENLVAIAAEKSPEAALAWAQSQKSLEIKRTATETALATWALHAPEAAGEALKNLGPQSGIDPENIVDRMSRFDAESALLWTLDYAPPGKQRAIIIDHATELDDPTAIQRVYEKLDGVKWQGAYMQHQLMNWNDRSIEGGLEWVLSTPPDRQAHWIRELGDGIGKTQFDAAMELASDIDDPKLRDAFEYGLIYSLSSTNLERAVELAEQSGNQDLIDETIAWGAYMNADNTYYAPQEIAAYAKRAFNSTYYNDIVSDLLRRWYPDDPEAALGWFETLEGIERQGAIWPLASTMTFRDPDAALEWASNLLNPSERDRALPAVLNSLASKEPETAFSLASSLGDQQTRTRETRDAVRIWAKRDPDKARQAVLSNPNLSEKEKQRLVVRIYGAQ